MRDPYKILGVDKDAGNDEIKRAYRQLSRKYHPDANINNPNKDSAESKFKEIQEAYKQVMDERENGSSSSFFGGFGQSGSQRQNYDSEELNHLKASEVYINNRKFKEALNVLNNMQSRTAMWYYYHAAANQGLGNYNLAVEDAECAMRMEPDNVTYQHFYSQIQSAGQWYQGQGAGFGFSGDNIGDCCVKILLINCMCGCCI